MRLTLKIDSATTEEMRALQSAVNFADAGNVTVGLNGPEHWTAETPPLAEDEAGTVMGIFAHALREFRVARTVG